MFISWKTFHDLPSVFTVFASESRSRVRRPSIPGPQPKKKSQEKHGPKKSPLNGWEIYASTKVITAFSPQDGAVSHWKGHESTSP